MSGGHIVPDVLAGWEAAGQGWDPLHKAEPMPASGNGAGPAVGSDRDTTATDAPAGKTKAARLPSSTYPSTLILPLTHHIDGLTVGWYLPGLKREDVLLNWTRFYGKKGEPMYSHWARGEGCVMWMGRRWGKAPTVLVRWDAQALWERGALTCYREMDAYLRKLCRGVVRSHVSRLDLAMDFTGLPGLPVPEEFRTRARYRELESPTSLALGKSNTVRMDLYSKSEQIRVRPQQWLGYATDGPEVWRLEFQFGRGELRRWWELDHDTGELRAPSVEEVLGAMATLWQWATQQTRWVQLTRSGKKSPRTRDEWDVLRGAWPKSDLALKRMAS